MCYQSILTLRLAAFGYTDVAICTKCYPSVYRQIHDQYTHVKAEGGCTLTTKDSAFFFCAGESASGPSCGSGGVWKSGCSDPRPHR